MRRCWSILVGLVVALAVLGLASRPAFAAKDAPPAEKEGGKGGHGDGELKGDSPPHIFTPVRIDLAVWTLVVFLALFFILKKVAWGPILEGLHKREEAIRGAVEEAKLARAETERVRAQFQKEMDEAFAKIPAMMDEARRDAARMAEEMRAKAAADIQADRQRLRREIEVARDQALQEIWGQAAQLATLISTKAIQRHISEEDHRRLVDEALAELRNAERAKGRTNGAARP
jgi:F-type H+-transporting ATPase subunit b